MNISLDEIVSFIKQELILLQFNIESENWLFSGTNLYEKKCYASFVSHCIVLN
jgi:hypothetical protein